MALPEKELSSVLLDHCYAKPWNDRIVSSLHRPVRYLFQGRSPSSPKPAEDIDVETSETPTLRESLKTSDLEQKVYLLKPETAEEMFEDNLKRDGWTTLQQRLISKVVKVLNQHRLGCLAFHSFENENVQKKLQFESSAKKLRVILASVSWEIKLTQWLHLTLIQNISRELLVAYVEILQTLRQKVPTLVDRMLNIVTPDGKLALLATQVMQLVLEKAKEEPPVSNPKLKLQSSPFFIMVPSGSNSPNSSFRMLNGSKKFQKWQNLLQSLGKVVSVSLHTVTAPQLLPMPVFVDAVISATVQRIQELKSNCPGRPIVLVGLQHGALMATQVAAVESVDALVLLGMPTTSIEGKRGEPDDPLLDLRLPVMFVVGENSSTTSVETVDHMRHNMKIDTALVLVAGASDSLKMLHKKKRSDNVLQTNVDNAVLDEISQFLGSVLTAALPAGSSDKGVAAKLGNGDRKIESGSVVKRVRLSTEKEDSGFHSALSGHNYSTPSTTPTFTQPRGRPGLSRVRGGRTRAPYGRTLSDSPTTRGRGVRHFSGGSVTLPQRDEIPGRRRSLNIPTDALFEPKDVASAGPSAFDETLPNEYKGGDSSETESAPPPEEEDMDDIMEDLRFREELLEKQKKNKKNQTKGKELNETPGTGERKRKTSGMKKPKVKQEVEDSNLQFSTEEDELLKFEEDVPEKKRSRKKKRRGKAR